MASVNSIFGTSLSSTLQTILAVNLMNTARQLPDGLYSLFLRIVAWWRCRVHITIAEQGPHWYTTNKAFSSVETYLESIASSRATSLRATTKRCGGGDDSDSEGEEDDGGLLLTMDDGESIPDYFDVPDDKITTGSMKKKKKTIVVRWKFTRQIVKNERSSGVAGSNEKKYYTLTFDARHRAAVLGQYLRHVIETSRELELQARRQKLYTNSMGEGDRSWTDVTFDHPATFGTLAMDPVKKTAIMEDLRAFSRSQAYYKKIGKAWKRGYLLYGPPGTGKSTMIATMANFLGYDVYYLELTAVKDNGELLRLITNTTAKSVLVVEDIDCSLDVVGARNESEKKKMMIKKKELGESRVTLSGLLNNFDGLWSGCTGERLVVFTTNHVDKLDPALIRKGRMDVHIELSYCGFEAFKVLAENYLGVLEEHRLFEEVRRLLEEVEITPADVAEHLLPKEIRADDRAAAGDDVVDKCLEELVRMLKERRDARAQLVDKG